MLTRAAFVARVASARKRTQIIYHTGSLLIDREQGENFLKINGVAEAARELYEAGKVYLVQRLVMPGVHDYIAVVR